MRGNKFYEFQLLYLAVVCAIGERAEGGGLSGARGAGALATLTRQYLLVYAIVMDWLQGPYVLRLRGALRVGVSGDQHGRKRLCLVFCAAYAGAGVCMCGPFLPILLLGRVVGGASSAFEAWLINALMGCATLVNGLVDTGAGVLSNACRCLPLVRHALCRERRVARARARVGRHLRDVGGELWRHRKRRWQRCRPLPNRVRIVPEDPRLLVLGLTQMCFEGSMYLFAPPGARAPGALHTRPAAPRVHLLRVHALHDARLVLLHVRRGACHARKAQRGSRGSRGSHSRSLPRNGTSASASVRSGCSRGAWAPARLLHPERAPRDAGALFRVPLNVFVVVSLYVTLVAPIPPPPLYHHSRSSSPVPSLPNPPPLQVFFLTGVVLSAIMLAFASMMTSVVVVGRVEGVRGRQI
ncbi:hypothetical protein C8J57DRAFT_1579863 [Mycena rebaudengoi]|nr:hypothetical protein C8J57DRAFT_1579863 [Mycena rebaudengoi]